MEQYKVEVLKHMINVLTRNIKMFSAYNDERSQERMYDMVKERRELAALVENGGVPMPGVYVDIMSYSASNGADTSWWG